MSSIPREREAALYERVRVVNDALLGLDGREIIIVLGFVIGRVAAAMGSQRASWLRSLRAITDETSAPEEERVH